MAAAGKGGLGYSYADTATAQLIHDKFAGLLNGQDALAINQRWLDLVACVRNLGRPGIVSMAVSAIGASRLSRSKARSYSL